MLVLAAAHPDNPDKRRESVRQRWTLDALSRLQQVWSYRVGRGVLLVRAVSEKGRPTELILWRVFFSTECDVLSRLRVTPPPPSTRPAWHDRQLGLTTTMSW